MYSVAKNTTFLTGASVLQRAVSFVYFIFVARAVGVENTGVYFFAIAFTSIFTVIADFGLGPVLTRQVARISSNAGRYLNTVLTTRLLFSVLTYGLLFLIVKMLGYDNLTRSLIYLAGVTMLFDNIHGTFYCVLRAKNNLLFESVGVFGSQLLTAIIGTVALIFHAPLYWLILAYTIPAALNALYSSIVVRKILAEPFKLRIDRALLWNFLSLSWPFAFAAIIMRLYSYTDSILMSKILPASELGLWSVPYKITFAFQFIPAALTASVYPAMSGLFATDIKKVGELFGKAVRYLLAVVLPLSFGLGAIASPALTKIYGAQYALSAPILQILLVSLVFGYISFVTTATLNATDRQKTQTALIFTALLVSVIFNLILIPRFGIIGAGFTAVVGNAFMCVAGIIMVAKKIVLPYADLWRYFWKTFISAAIMGALSYYLVLKISFIIVIPIAAILYGVLMFVFGGVDRELIKRLSVKIFDF